MKRSLAIGLLAVGTAMMLVLIVYRIVVGVEPMVTRPALATFTGALALLILGLAMLFCRPDTTRGFDVMASQSRTDSSDTIDG